MQAIIGLGNPGERYEKNRHNAGFLLLDQIADYFGESGWHAKTDFYSEIIKLPNVILVKPQTFMNSSGKAVKKIIDYFNIPLQYVYVAHDDLDIKLGELKIQKGVGPKLHNGINSIEEKLGSSQFWRIRIGVDNRNSENRVAGDVYSLQNFTTKELKTIKDVNTRIVKDLNFSK